MLLTAADAHAVTGLRLRADRRAARRGRRVRGVPALPDALVRGWDAAAVQAGAPIAAAGAGEELATLAWPLPGEAPAAAAAAGRTAAVVPALGAPADLHVWWTDPDGAVTLPGGTGRAGRGGALHVVAPSGTVVARFVDGTSAGPPDVVGTGTWPAWFPGLHRVELWREDVRGHARRWVLPTGAWLA